MSDTPRYMEAINQALADEMARDDDVILMGVDVGAAGGVYGVTKGLHERFGAERVWDTPIAEAGVLGAATGAAISGLRPVAEVMYMDFISVCLDPIVNQAAKLRYMTGGGVSVPIVFRMQTGGGRSGGAQHSQSLEAVLAHIPGLKVFCPGDARDAHDLLVEAIRDSGPVCYVENRRLYRRRDDEWDRPALPAGQPRIVRAGEGATVVTWGRMVSETRAVLDELDGAAANVELIDLRTLVPCDLAIVAESVRRTGRCLVVHEAVERHGPGGEIVARLVEQVLWHVDGPVRRLGALPTPVPYSPPLEAEMLPSPERIAAAIRSLLDD